MLAGESLDYATVIAANQLVMRIFAPPVLAPRTVAAICLERSPQLFLRGAALHKSGAAYARSILAFRRSGLSTC